MPVPEWRAPRQRYWLHALLLLATCFTTLVVGARMQYNFAHSQPVFSLDDSAVPLFPVSWTFSHPARLLLGLPFAGTLMLILLAHEMGHYLYCERYGVWATLPFFIPAPTLIGTFGAFIRIRSPIRSRTALFDIGIAGPIAGFVVAVAVLLVSLGLSKPIPAGTPATVPELGFPLIFQLVHRLLAAQSAGQGVARLPLDRVLLHPTTIAAGGNVRDVAQPASRRTTRWRTYCVFDCAAGAQIRIAADDSDSFAHGVLPVDGMVCVGDSAAAKQLAASASGRVAAGFRRAGVAGRLCAADAGAHADTGALWTRVRAGGYTGVSRTVGNC
jgi:Zn-dependent protease